MLNSSGNERRQAFWGFDAIPSQAGPNLPRATYRREKHPRGDIEIRNNPSEVPKAENVDTYGRLQ